MSRHPSSMEWMAWQVAVHQDSAPPPRVPGFNPRPPGHPVNGSASDDVLRWLTNRPSRISWWSMHQIIRGTGRSGKACCWAVIYLHRIGHIERTRDCGHSRYLRYRATIGDKR